MDLEAAFCRYHGAVTPEGADYNGHMNVATFPMHFEEATRLLFEELDISRAYKETTDHAFFATQQHLLFKNELRLEQRFSICSQILNVRQKALHVMHFMRRTADGILASTSEMLFVHVNLTCRRSTAISEPVLARLRLMQAKHKALPWPAEAGMRIECAR